MSLGNKGSTDEVLTIKHAKPFLVELLDWIKSILLALAIVFVIHHFVFNLSTVRGDSMQPTLLNGEWLFINKISYRVGDPRIHDVIILKDPSPQFGKQQYLVKRIIARPGDTVEVSGNKLYLNGIAQEESYTDTPIEDGNYGPLIIPDAHYFVMGDNRHQSGSNDSRSFGAVPMSLIEGRAEFILWPISQIGGL